MIRFCLFTKNEALLATVEVQADSIPGFEFFRRLELPVSLPEADLILVGDDGGFGPFPIGIPVLVISPADGGFYHYVPGMGNRFFLLKELLLFGLSQIPFYPRNLLFYLHRETFVIINTELAFIIADRHSSDFYFTDGRKLTLFQHLGWFENQLPLPFFRVHKSYVVNASVIYRIQKSKKTIWLRPKGMQVPYGETYGYQIELIEKWLDGRRIFCERALTREEGRR